MQIPHDSTIVVLDGEKALFLRNEGDEDYPNFIVEAKREQDNPPNREQAANMPGRMFDGTGHKSAVDDTDWHQLAKDRFAQDIARLLYTRVHAGEIDRLVLIAAPHSLGAIRPELHQEVTDRLIGEVGKEMTNHPIPEIEKIVSRH